MDKQGGWRGGVGGQGKGRAGGGRWAGAVGGQVGKADREEQRREACKGESAASPAAVQPEGPGRDRCTGGSKPVSLTLLITNTC